MAAPAFVAGDWGTSHLRLSLCDEQGRVLETRKGRGVSAARADVAGEFESAVKAWSAHGPLPAVLCGMVGSTIGWHEVRYLTCPIRPQMIATGVHHFSADGRDVFIAPGLSCRNKLMAPDVMRGEETQILGALRLDPQLAQGRQVLCLPGTHTKWVSLNDGVIEHFLTAVGGEMFDLLLRHSVLVNYPEETDAVGSPAFKRALEKTKIYPDAELTHLLFEVRSGQLVGELKKTEAADFLSGLIIGQDVSGMRRFFRSELEDSDGVVIISTPQLGALYGEALRAREIGVRMIDGDEASVAGLSALYHALRGVRHVA